MSPCWTCWLLVSRLAARWHRWCQEGGRSQHSPTPTCVTSRLQPKMLGWSGTAAAEGRIALRGIERTKCARLPLPLQIFPTLPILAAKIFGPGISPRIAPDRRTHWRVLGGGWWPFPTATPPHSLICSTRAARLAPALGRGSRARVARQRRPPPGIPPSTPLPARRWVVPAMAGLGFSAVATDVVVRQLGTIEDGCPFP